MNPHHENAKITDTNTNKKTTHTVVHSRGYEFHPKVGQFYLAFARTLGLKKFVSDMCVTSLKLFNKSLLACDETSKCEWTANPFKLTYLEGK